MRYKFRRRRVRKVASENGGQNGVDCPENRQLSSEKGYEKNGIAIGLGDLRSE